MRELEDVAGEHKEEKEGSQADGVLEVEEDLFLGFELLEEEEADGDDLEVVKEVVMVVGGNEKY
jgi:hypothetical protein